MSGRRTGTVLFCVMVAFALAGPLLAPFDPAQTIGLPFDAPGGQALLGTDFLGRDVLSRALSGGWTVLAYAGLATLLAYVVALPIGLAAGYTRSWLDSVLMRGVDVLIAFPALVFILLVATGLGRGILPVVLATAIIQVPAIARIVRTATAEQSVRGFVEAAVVRGESSVSVLGREVLPNIARPIAADIGLRCTWSVLLIAGVNFLGLGMQPPAADWGLMVSENRAGMDLDLNPASVLVPAIMLGVLTVAINLISDALAGGER